LTFSIPFYSLLYNIWFGIKISVTFKTKTLLFFYKKTEGKLKQGSSCMVTYGEDSQFRPEIYIYYTVGPVIFLFHSEYFYFIYDNYTIWHRKSATYILFNSCLILKISSYFGIYPRKFQWGRERNEVSANSFRGCVSKGNLITSLIHFPSWGIQIHNTPLLFLRLFEVF
jgi:hypothetical protein